MATTKTLKPTNVTISIPEFTDQPDQRVNSNCIDKEADAINTLSEQIGHLTKATISSRLSSNYGTITAYESYLGNLCAVAISFNCTTAITKNVTFMTGLKDSVVNRAPVVPMYNTDDGKLYHANVSSSGELTSHTEALPTGNYRMNFAYVIN